MSVQGPTFEGDLLRRLGAGDEEALVALYRRWQGPLYRFALRMAGSEATAEDVVQEVFLALMRNPGGYRPERGALPSYLFGIARNQVLRRLEREHAHVLLEPDAAPDPADIDVDLGRAFDVERVRRAILALPAHQREVVVLCELEQLSYAEAAQALDCAVGTIRSRLHRARQQLAEILRGRGTRAEPVRAGIGGRS